MAKNKGKGSGAKGIFLGIIIGIIAAAASAVGVVFILIKVNGGSAQLNLNNANTSQEASDADEDKTADVKEDKQEDKKKNSDDNKTVSTSENATDDNAIDENASEGEKAAAIPEGNYIALDGNYGDLLKGIDNKEKLAYVLGVAENCREKNWDMVQYALGEVWYEREVENVYGKIDQTEENESVYSVDALNALYSFITDEKISDVNKPSIARIADNKIYYRYNDVYIGCKSEVVIKSIKYIDGGDMYIEYLYKVVLSATGDSGIYGESIATCILEDGKYKLSSIDAVYRNEYKYSTIADESFNEEFNSYK